MDDRILRARAGRLATALGRPEEWRSGVLLWLSTMSAATTTLLCLRLPVSTSIASRVVIFGSLAGWILISLFTAVRRHLTPRQGGAAVVLIGGLLIAVGTTFPSPAVRWVCAAALVVVPVMARMFLARRGVILVTSVAMAGTTAIAELARVSTAVTAYAAVTLIALCAVPITVVSILLHQLQLAREEAEALASTDQLTGLLNRRGLTERIDSVVEHGAAAGEPLTVMTVDVDHFKAVNDTWGHATGDEVLVGVARAVQAVAREGDLVVRLGGEEFAWIGHFPGPIHVWRAAQRMRIAVASQSEPGLPSVTISVGIATEGPGSRGAAPAMLLSRLLVHADRALYAAKAAGRDRVVIAPLFADGDPQVPSRPSADGEGNPERAKASDPA